jgi:hypothetical protein
VSKAKGRATRCFCNKKLRPGDKRCPRCDRVTARGLEAGLQKAVAAQAGARFVGKAASGPRVARAPGQCRSQPGGNCCTRCGQKMPAVPVPSISNKSAFSFNYWQRELGDSSDPGLRELVQQMIHNGGS